MQKNYILIHIYLFASFQEIYFCTNILPLYDYEFSIKHLGEMIRFSVAFTRSKSLTVIEKEQNLF